MRRSVVAVAVPLLLLAAACQPAPAGRWEFVTPPPGDVANPVTATVLDSGRVLVTSSSLPAAASRYDPGTDTWLATPSLHAPHGGAHVAVKLSDGRVLVVGGFSGSCQASEVFSPASVGWTSVARTPADCWDRLAGTRLADGRALVATARPANISPDSWQLQGEVYDPAANRWTATTALHLPRMPPADDGRFHYESDGWRIASLTTSGSVTLALVEATTRDSYLNACDPDGYCSADEFSGWVRAAAYNASTGVWQDLGVPPGISFGVAATLLASGRVLLTGGYRSEDRGGWDLSFAAVTWDPSTGQWAERPPMSTARFRHAAVRLADGRVLISGGEYSGYGSGAPELYVPNSTSATWSPAATEGRHRIDHHAVLLKDGRVLVLGGGSDTAEVFTP